MGGRKQKQKWAAQARHRDEQAEAKTHEAKPRATDAEMKATATEQRATEAEMKAKAERRATNPEIVTAEHRATEAEMKATAADHRATEAQMKQAAAEHATTQAQKRSYAKGQDMLREQTLRLAAEKQASVSEATIAVLLAERRINHSRLKSAQDHAQALLFEMETMLRETEVRAVTAEAAALSRPHSLCVCCRLVPAADLLSSPLH